MSSQHARRSSSNIYQVRLKDKYETIRRIGDGSFGTVELAREKTSGRNGQLVAIKTMKKQFSSTGACLKLREVESLDRLSEHHAIVRIFETFYDPSTRLFHIVMEHMEQNLFQLMNSRKHVRFELSTVKSILYQILEAIDHCHQNNCFHRDIKPENVLVSSGNQRSNASPFALSKSNTDHIMNITTSPDTPNSYMIKLADFGLARELSARPPYTAYISTRWYRAPEILLKTSYSSPVDMWAFAAMAVELATLRPLFPGEDELDQIWKICEVMGSPAAWCDKAQGPIGGGAWRQAETLARQVGFSFPQTPPIAISSVLGDGWPESFSGLITGLLYWDPCRRMTSRVALQHEFFRSCRRHIASVPRIVTKQQDRTSLIPWEDNARPGPEVFESVLPVPPSKDRVSLGPAQELLNQKISSSIMSTSPFSHVTKPRSAVDCNPRESWFSKKRDSIIGRHSLRHNAITPRAHDLRTSTLMQRVPRDHRQMEEDIKQPIPAFSPLTLSVLSRKTATPVVAPDLAFARNQSDESALDSQSSLNGMDTSGRGYSVTNDPTAFIPVKTIRAPQCTPVRRAIGQDYASAGSHSTRVPHVQISSPEDEARTGLSLLFPHLKKRHKKSETQLSPRRQRKSDNLELNSITPVQSLYVNADTTSYDYERSKSHRDPKVDRRSSLSNLCRHRPDRECQPNSTNHSCCDVVCNNAIRTRIEEQTTVNCAKTRGRAPAGVHMHTDEELLAASLAMKRLSADNEWDQPSQHVSEKSSKKVPSYAKSTAASLRRSSSIGMSRCLSHLTAVKALQPGKTRSEPVL